MFIPKKAKWRKQQRGAWPGRISGQGSELNFGAYGLKATTAGLVSSRHLESARRAMTRYIQRGGKVWIRIFPAHAMTRKGDEVGMGKGKGGVDHYVFKVERGRVLFEMDGVTDVIAREAMRLAAHKLPVRSKFVSKV